MHRLPVSGGWLIALLFFASFSLHLWSIEKPNIPAFDEVHFATYAAQYARHETHFDIHPPLGKLLYGAVLTFFPSSTYSEANFIKIDTRGEIQYTGIFSPFGNFPYVALRILASLFGALIPVLGYLLLRDLTDNPYAPFLGGLFLLFENAILMETRLILLNGMLLVFGLAGLLFFFGKRRNIYLAGILLGLALSIKLSAIVFVLTICLGFMFSVPNISFERYGRAVATTIGIALFVLVLSVLSHFLFSSPMDQIELLQKFGSPGLSHLSPPFSDLSDLFQKIFRLMNASILQFHAMVSNYIEGVTSHIAMSPWYTWPFMSGGFTYYQAHQTAPFYLTPLRALFVKNSGTIALTGNAFLWISGIFSVILSAYVLLRKKWRSQFSDGTLILLLGWVAGILPFGVVVSRVSFLYHYFPPLVFSLLLAALWTGRLLEKSDPTKVRWIALGILGGVLGGFFLSLRFTYGL